MGCRPLYHALLVRPAFLSTDTARMIGYQMVSLFNFLSLRSSTREFWKEVKNSDDKEKKAASNGVLHHSITNCFVHAV